MPEGPSPPDLGEGNQESEPMGWSPQEVLWFAFREREEGDGTNTSHHCKAT